MADPLNEYSYRACRITYSSFRPYLTQTIIIGDKRSLNITPRAIQRLFRHIQAASGKVAFAVQVYVCITRRCSM